MAKENKKAINLRDEYLKLPSDEQAMITNFFNLHNAAHFMYDKLSKEGQSYVNYCIRMAQEANRIEKKNE